MKYLFIAILVLFGGQLLVAQNDSIDWVTDLKYLKTELPKKHINLFFQQPKLEFDGQIDKLIDSVPNLTTFEIFNKLSKILAKVGDSHTFVDYGYLYKADRRLPYRLYWFKDGLFVTHAGNSCSKLLGHKLISINKYPVNQIVDSLKTLITVDNEAIIKTWIPPIISFVPHLEFFGFLSGDTIRVLSKSVEGNEVETVFDKNCLKWEKEVRYEPDSMAYCWSNRNLFFANKHFEQDSIFYIQYNRCWGKELEKKLGSKKMAKSYPSFNQFKKDILKQIKSSTIKKIVFDLRFNVGGSSLQGTLLINEIAKNDKLNQKHKLFVITGKHTFSSGIINLMDFKEKTNATFVGEETSGKPNHYGVVKYLTLPSSGLKVNYSTKYINNYKLDTNTFFPDVEIETSFDDYKNGIDPVFDYIKNL